MRNNARKPDGVHAILGVYFFNCTALNFVEYKTSKFIFLNVN